MRSYLIFHSPVAPPPSHAIILLPIAFIKRRNVGDLFFSGAAGFGVVYYGADHFGSGGELLVVGPVYFVFRVVLSAYPPIFDRPQWRSPGEEDTGLSYMIETGRLLIRRDW